MHALHCAALHYSKAKWGIIMSMQPKNKIKYEKTPCVIPNFQIFDTDQAIDGLSICTCSFWNNLAFVFWMFLQGLPLLCSVCRLDKNLSVVHHLLNLMLLGVPNKHTPANLLYIKFSMNGHVCIH